jgi:hypothetical protein
MIGRAFEALRLVRLAIAILPFGIYGEDAYNSNGEESSWGPLQCPECLRVLWADSDDIACNTGHSPERMERSIDRALTNSPDISYVWLA